VPFLSVSRSTRVSSSILRWTGAPATGRPSSVVRFPVQATVVSFTSARARVVLVFPERTSNVATSE
jgi:hypothetical protein